MKQIFKTNRTTVKWQRVLALLLTSMFLLSAAMTGTTAWADLSQHRTNVAQGELPKLSQALLQKYEKDTQTPVPGAHFTLYRMNTDGTAMPVQTWITGADGQILAADLEPGAYYWQETQAPHGFLPETEEGQPKKYRFTLPNEDGEPVLSIAYNVRRRAGLTVTKTVAGEGADLSREFAFTAVIGGQTESFALKHGQSKTFEDIPAGTIYTVTETPVQGYATTSENNTGSVPVEGVTAAFTNRYQAEYGSLAVTKAVTGQDADLEKEFAFTATIGGETTSFSLKHNQTKTFGNIPLGTNYTVTEADYAGEHYFTTGRVYSGTVQAKDTAIALPVVNHYLPEPPEPAGSLEITKTVAGSNADPNRAFSFQIIFTGEGAPVSPQAFTLKHGEKKTFADVPHGVAYAVAETDAGGYLPDFTGTSGVVIGDRTVTVNFINRVPAVPEVRLTVTKRVMGNPPENDSEKLFAFILTINGAPHAFSLKAGETSEEFAVRPGDAYTLAEQEPGAGYVKGGVVNGAGVAGDENIEIIQTNHYTGPETIDIEGEKTWQYPAGTQLPDGAAIRLMNGNVTVATKTVTAAGNWRYAFTNLPKHDALGNAIPYAVEEARIPGWRPVVTGYDIANHHQPPVIDEAIEVEKATTGTPPADTTFQFLLTSINNAPMPAANEIAVTGAGKASFGQIAYTVPGTFIYTIAEKEGSAANWSYDVSVYTLTVTVSEDGDGQLAISRALTKADAPAEKILFTNHYVATLGVFNVRVTKAWVGEGPHPQSIQVQLYRDGTAYGTPASLSQGNNWTRTWPELDKGPVWTVDEPSIPQGYTKTVTGDAVNGFTITNTKGTVPETNSVKVTKVWKGEDENRPASVVAQLYKDGAAHGVPVVLSETNAWTYIWSGLEKEPAWAADEVNAPQGYVKAVTGDAANGFVVTNTKQPAQQPSEEMILSGKKTWNHGDNPVGKRPTSMTVIIRADGAIFTQRLITADDHWGWYFKLPKYDGEGKEIVYTVDEARIEDYVKTVDGYNLINTYNPDGDSFIPPQTNDSSALSIWLAVMAASLMGLAAVFFLPKRKKRERIV